MKSFPSFATHVDALGIRKFAVKLFNENLEYARFKDNNPTFLFSQAAEETGSRLTRVETSSGNYVLRPGREYAEYKNSSEILLHSDNDSETHIEPHYDFDDEWAQGFTGGDPMDQFSGLVVAGDAPSNVSELQLSRVVAAGAAHATRGVTCESQAAICEVGDRQTSQAILHDSIQFGAHPCPGNAPISQELIPPSSPMYTQVQPEASTSLQSDDVLLGSSQPVLDSSNSSSSFQEINSD